MTAREGGSSILEEIMVPFLPILPNSQRRGGGGERGGSPNIGKKGKH
jgi:hypothetical protein